MYGNIIKARLSKQAYKIRRELGLSQEQMSEQLRITTRAYGDLERGKYCFSAFALLFLLRLSGKEQCWELVLSVCEEVTKIDSATVFREA